MRPESRASSAWDWLKINLGLVGWPGRVAWPGGLRGVAVCEAGPGAGTVSPGRRGGDHLFKASPGERGWHVGSVLDQPHRGPGLMPHPRSPGLSGLPITCVGSIVLRGTLGVSQPRKESKEGGEDHQLGPAPREQRRVMKTSSPRPGPHPGLSSKALPPSGPGSSCRRRFGERPQGTVWLVPCGLDQGAGQALSLQRRKLSSGLPSNPGAVSP